MSFLNILNIQSAKSPSLMENSRMSCGAKLKGSLWTGKLTVVSVTRRAVAQFHFTVCSFDLSKFFNQFHNTQFPNDGNRQKKPNIEIYIYFLLLCSCFRYCFKPIFRPFQPVKQKAHRLILLSMLDQNTQCTDCILHQPCENHAVWPVFPAHTSLSGR